MQPRNLKLQSLSEEEFDPELRDKLAIITEKKDHAVANEDFDLAIEFKDICDKLKMIGSDLSVLEKRKAEAIANEDFESAKALKLQVDKLRLLVDNLDPYDPFKQVSAKQHVQQQMLIQEKPYYGHGDGRS